MGLFSGLKRLFGSHQCQCQEARLYTQREMDAQSKYWIDIVERAKEQVRKECEKSSLLILPNLPVNTEEQQVKKKKNANGKGSIIDYGVNRASRNLKRRKKRNNSYKSEADVSGKGHERPYGKDNQEFHKDMKESIINFCYDCCEWVESKVNSDKFMEVYIWWCQQKGIKAHFAKCGVGIYLRKTGVKCLVIEKNYSKHLYYLGIRIRSDILKKYEEYKKTQTTHVAQSGAPVVCRDNGELF